jgi:antitoxin ParD1/3/4
MPTRNVNLTAEQDAFIESVVREGRYQNASEAVREALRGWQQRIEEDDLRLENLRAMIAVADRQIAEGKFIEASDETLDALFDELTEKAEAR